MATVALPLQRRTLANARAAAAASSPWAFSPGTPGTPGALLSLLQPSRDDSVLSDVLGAGAAAHKQRGPHQLRPSFPPIPEGCAAGAAPPSPPPGAAAHDDLLLAGILDGLPSPKARQAPGRLGQRPRPAALDLTRTSAADDDILAGLLEAQGGQVGGSAASAAAAARAPPRGVAAALDAHHSRAAADDNALSAALGATPAGATATAAALADFGASATGGSRGRGRGGLEANPQHAPTLALLKDLRATLGGRPPRVEVVAGGLGRGGQPNQLYRPIGLAVDGEGGVVIADNGNDRVVRWLPGSSKGELVAGGGGELDGPGFDDPIGVVIPAGGGVLITGGGGLWHAGTSAAPELLSCGASPEWFTPPSCSAQAPFYTGIALDLDGAVLICDTFGRTVKRGHWEPGEGGLFSDIAPGELSDAQGGPGHLPRPGQLLRPFGVAVDHEGALLVADSGNHRVVRWGASAPNGEVVAGGRGRGGRLDQLSYPRAVIVEGPGSYLVADTYNNRVVRWVRGEPRGTVVLGGRGQGGRIDQLNRPMGLALDGSGGLLVADSGNHRVVRCALRPPPGEAAAKYLSHSAPLRHTG